MSNKCLVTGGSGFIGSHLCESLLNKGYEIVCIDNLITGDKKNIKHLLQNRNFQFIEDDITKPISIEFKYIFHLASPASPNKKSKKSFINHPIETLLANSLGTYYLLELAKKTGAQFLFASTSEIYGDPNVSPQNENYFGNVNPIGIRSVYDEGKRFGESITMVYHRNFNLNVRVVRIFNTYGPRMQVDDGRVIPNFISQALDQKPITVYGDGQQTRSCCYIDDMVDGIKKAMFSQKSKGEVFNLGNPDERTVLELATLIKKMTNSSSEIAFEELPEDDPRIRKPDITKAKGLLNWEPKVELEEGLEKTIQYFKHL